MFAAWNRGDPLLYWFASLLLTLVLLGCALPYVSLHGLTARRAGPLRAHEDDRIELELHVRNSAFFSRYMVEVVDRVPAAAPGEQEIIGFFARLAGRGQGNLVRTLTCYKRGYYRLGPLELRSAFPLGLITRSRVLPGTEAALLVYPKTYPVRSFPLGSAGQRLAAGTDSMPKAGGYADFSGVREYRPGDNPRHIHWASSARHGELVVKEFDATPALSIALLPDLASKACAGSGKNTTLEYAISMAASIARHACIHGWDSMLYAQGARTHVVPRGRGETHFAAMLEKLAYVEADGALDYPSVVAQAAASIAPGSMAVLFFSSPGREDDECLKALGCLLARGIRPACVLMNRSTFEGVSDRAQARASRLFGWIVRNGLAVKTVDSGASLDRVLETPWTA